MQYNAINTMQYNGKNTKNEDLTKEEQKEGEAGGAGGVSLFFHIEETKRSRASLRLQQRSELACEKSTRATSCGNDKRPYHNIRT